MNNLYKKHCFEYLKKGFSVIPDSAKSKKPLVKEWTKYGKIMSSEEEVIQWCSTFHESNIALMLGELSGVIAIDVDTEDEEEIKIIKALLPESPCEKIGKKGFTRFYRYKNNGNEVLSKPSVTVDGKQSKEVILELLSTGRKTTIPPSIHCGTGLPYKWVGKSILDVSKRDLPLLPTHLLSTIKLEIGKASLYKSEPIKQKGGRHHFLGALASQMIADRLDITTAALRLIEEDKNSHDKPLFSDKEENSTDNSFLNALTFYMSFLKSINTKRLEEGLEPELPLPNSNSVRLEDRNTGIVKGINLPEPTGLLKEIYDLILKNSYVEQPVFALSAAISLIGTIASRKFKFQGATSNTYILNIADSGSGKDSCQKVIKEVLTTIKADDLLGATSYPSEASITVNIESHPTRLDIIDEASGFLQAASNGGATFQVGIGDTLCELYSCSDTHYLGKVLASNFGRRTGSCYRPHLNLLCSTTYKGISESLTRATLEKGLFARFLTFFGDNDKAGKRIKKRTNLKANAIEGLQDINLFHNPLFTGDNTLGMPAYELECDLDADNLLDKYHKVFDIMKRKTNNNSVIKPVISRLYQQMMKIVLISAVANKELERLPRVTSKDVEFAYQLILYYFQSIESFIEQNLFDSKRGKQLNEVLRNITDMKEEGITSSDLTKNTKSLTVREREDILRDLIASRQVEMRSTNDPNIVIFKRIIHEQ